MTKRILVTFDDTEWQAIVKNFKTGRSDAELVRNVVLDSLDEKDDVTKELATHEIMIAALAQELSSKGVISFEDWEQKVRDQVT